MDRVRDSDGLVGVGADDPEDHIRKWLDTKGLKRLLETDFAVVSSTSVIPMGRRGWVRLINSYKLNRVASWLVPRSRLDALKERMGLGYSIIAIGRRKLGQRKS